MTKAYRYTLPDHYFACSVEDGGLLPGNATHTPPPAPPWDHTWPRWTDPGWEMVEDHRERTPPYFAAELKQAATEYWLPAKGDDWQSPARSATEPGPLPEGYRLTRPVKPLAVAQAEKRREIDAGYEAALVAAITMPSANPTPIGVAVETSALLAVDPDGVDSIRAVLDARRTELLALVDAAATVEVVEAITVIFPA